MQSYTEADAVLTGRCKERRKVANNTWLERRGDDAIAVRLHDTDIVTYYADGGIRLDTGGWFTVTTKARMNEYTPFGISSTRGEWSVAQRNPNFNHGWSWQDGPNPEPYWLTGRPFHDGMIWLKGKWYGVPSDDEVIAERAERAAQRRAIAAFIKGITPDEVIRQFEHPEGDCFMCRFGEASCLAAHVEERYFHLSLMRNALAAQREDNVDFMLRLAYMDAQHGRVSDIGIKRPLRKYLNRHLLEGVATR